MISDVNFTTSQIKMYKEDKCLGSASGFFFRTASEKYYVTNRHVVINENEDFYPDKIELNLHKNKEELSQNQILEILLYDEGEKIWLEHPNYRMNGCDIAIIPLNIKTLKNSGIIIFNTSSITFIGSDLINSSDLNPFGDLAVVGYPLGFYDINNNLPVYRKAMLASQYGVEFNGKPYFLIDANLHPGTSGSPVLNSHHTLFKQDGYKEGYKIFGIHSAQHMMQGKPLGLNVVWYSYLLNEIIDGRK